MLNVKNKIMKKTFYEIYIFNAIKSKMFLFSKWAKVRNLQGKLGGESQCVTTEAPVCGGQWSGDSILRPGANNDEERVLCSV